MTTPDGSSQESKRRSRQQRRQVWEAEVEALGRGRNLADTPPPTSTERREMHGRKVGYSTRPYVKAGKGWEPALTNRQMFRGRLCRTARSWGRMLDTMARTPMTMEQFVEGLSDEELVRGRLRDKNGNFTGAPPSWVPREFHRACVRELLRRGQELWREHYLDAIAAMTNIATDPRADPKDRIKAATFVIERIEGKVPERLEITAEEPWQAVISEIVADVPDEAITRARHGVEQAQQIIDAEIVEEHEDEPAPTPIRRRSTRTTGNRRRRT